MKRLPFGQPKKLGWIDFPETTVSYPNGGKCAAIYTGAITTTIERMPIEEKGIVHVPDFKEQWELDEFLRPYRENYDPALFEKKLEWATVGHNQRTDEGWKMQVFRCFGTIGETAAATVFNVIALGATNAATVITGGPAVTPAKTDLSLGIITASVTTHEFVVGTGPGLQRAAATVQNLGSVPSALDSTSTHDIYKSFNTITCTADVYNSAIFDSTTVAGSHLYCEGVFAVASVISGDTLNVTWTCTF